MTNTGTSSFDDRVLPIATVAIRIVMIILWVALAALAVGLVALYFNQARILGDAEFQALKLNPERFFPVITTIMLGAMAVVFASIQFMRRLLAITLTVAVDPFVPENAVRLRVMAWLLLAIEVGTFALGWGTRLLWDVPKHTPDLPLTSIIAVLSLFVLARVFTRGTQMREEIEGTV